jgi:F-type H+-transporting ATPase subunit delta
MKTELSSVAHQYARALIELASDVGATVTHQVLKDLTLVNAVIKDTADFDLILHHPSVKSDEKKQLLIQAFQPRVHDLTMRLIELLADKRRLGLLPQVEVQYRQLLQAKENIVSATLTSAEKLSETDTNRLREALTKKLGKKLELELKVDPALIAGLVVRIGDEVIDGSVRGKLRALEKSLLSV